MERTSTNRSKDLTTSCMAGRLMEFDIDSVLKERKFQKAKCVDDGKDAPVPISNTS